MLQKYRYHFILFLVVVVGYFPLTFFQSTLLHDDIDVALSTKYYAGECLQNGLLPLWNPYQLWGFPAHADLQYTNWNIEVMITGLLFGYNYIILHILFVFYVFIGALGAFLLAKQLSKNAKTACYIACIYVLSGLFTAHVQSLVTILGLVWMPYVILYFLIWLKNTTLKNTFLLCLFSYLLVTLGYQAFAFMLAPVFLVVFISNCVKDYRVKQYDVIKQKWLFGFLAVIILCVLLCPVLVTQFQSQPFVARLNGMSVEEVMSNPFSPLSLISFFNPLLTIAHDDWFKTDVTMRNVFIGTLPFVLLLLSLFKKNKTKLDIIFLVFACFYLLGSFGDIIPVRKLMYYTLPGFKLFRFPALLRVVAILLGLCYLAVNFNETVKQFYEKKKLRSIILIFLLLLNTTIMCFCFIGIDSFTFFNNTPASFNQKIITANPLEIAFYISGFQIFLWSIALISFNRSTSFFDFKKKLVTFTLVEMIVVLLIYGQITAFSNVKPNEFQQNFSKLPKGFPYPSTDALSDTKYKFDHIQHLWKNTGGFKKQLIVDDAWTSFYFMNYDQLNQNQSVKDSLLSYPFIYFSKPNTNHQFIKLPIPNNDAFIINTFHKRDTNALFQYTAFNANTIGIKLKIKQPVVINLQQTYFTGWHVTIDGVEKKLIWNAGLLMSVEVPKGLHTVEFKYTNSLFSISLIVSYLLIILMLITIIIVLKIDRTQKRMLLFGFISFVFTLCTLFYTRSSKTNYIVKNSFSFNNSANSVNYDFNCKTDIAALWNVLKTTAPNKINYQWNNYYNSPELLYSLGFNPESLLEKVEQLNGSIYFSPSKNDLKTLITTIFDSNYVNKTFIDTTSQNGFSLVLNEKENPYSTPITLNSQKLIGHNLYGKIYLKAPSNSNAMVVCNLKHTDNTEESYYFSVNKYLLYNAQWQSIPYYFNLKDKIKSNDVIGIFIMNASKSSVYVKSISSTYFK